jgi:hypothetical protein
MLALKLANTLETQDTGFNIYSLDFNGTDEYVTAHGVGSEIDYNVGTISVWVQLDTVSSSGSITKAWVGSDNAFHLMYHAAQNKVFFTRKAGGASVTIEITDAIEGDSKWHHITATWSKTDDEIKLYLDGALKDTGTGLGTWDGGAIDNVQFAKNEGSAYFEGHIAQIAYFDSVKSTSSLLVTNHEPLNLTGMSGLVGYWHFDEGSGTTSVDSSGNENAATLVNTPTWSTEVPYKAN